MENNTKVDHVWERTFDGFPSSTRQPALCFLAWRETTLEEAQGRPKKEDQWPNVGSISTVYGNVGGESRGQEANWNLALETSAKRVYVTSHKPEKLMTLAVSTNDDSDVIRYRFGVQITPQLLKSMVDMARDAGWFNKPHTSEEERRQAMMEHSTYNPNKPD